MKSTSSTQEKLVPLNKLEYGKLYIVYKSEERFYVDCIVARFSDSVVILGGVPKIDIFDGWINPPSDIMCKLLPSGFTVTLEQE